MKIIWIAALLALVLFFPVAAGAHSYPETSEPREGTTVGAVPKEVKILFDGDIQPPFVQIQVQGPDGREAHQGKAVAEGARTLRVGLTGTAPGRYTVKWRVLATDGHVTEGSYTFTVRP